MAQIFTSFWNVYAFISVITLTGIMLFDLFEEELQYKNSLCNMKSTFFSPFGQTCSVQFTVRANPRVWVLQSSNT